MTPIRYKTQVYWLLIDTETGGRGPGAKQVRRKYSMSHCCLEHDKSIRAKGRETKAHNLTQRDYSLFNLEI